jgi:hypothetical protein
MSTPPPYAYDPEVVRAGRGDGWMFFAGTVLGMTGIMKLIDAIWAFRYKGELPANLKDGLLGDDLTTYAWTFLVIGVVLIAASFLVLQRSPFGRWVGIIAAVIGWVGAMVWMPYFPIWALVYIVLSALVIYGLVVYGGRVPE